MKTFGVAINNKNVFAAANVLLVTKMSVGGS